MTYATAKNLGISALGALGFSVLLVLQTVSTGHESPPVAILVLSLSAFVVTSLSAIWSALVTRRRTDLTTADVGKPTERR